MASIVPDSLLLEHKRSKCRELDVGVGLHLKLVNRESRNVSSNMPHVSYNNQLDLFSDLRFSLTRTLCVRIVLEAHLIDSWNSVHFDRFRNSSDQRTTKSARSRNLRVSCIDQQTDVLGED